MQHYVYEILINQTIAGTSRLVKRRLMSSANKALKALLYSKVQNQYDGLNWPLLSPRLQKNLAKDGQFDIHPNNEDAESFYSISVRKIKVE